MITEGKPAIREPVQCGRDHWLAFGREPSQMGWYEFVAMRHKGESVLDVGCGMGVGVAFMNHFGCHAFGIDNDTRLEGRPKTIIDAGPVEPIGGIAVDVVTCIDVIEHVVNDVPFMKELKHWATKAVYVSTPNFLRSQARNQHHAREYTITEFAETFKPDEIWVSYPDGWAFRQQLPWPCGEAYNSPDGDPWPHFCGVFYK